MAFCIDTMGMIKRTIVFEELVVILYCDTRG